MVFHIGYPRTGTTFLQKIVFPEFRDLAVTDLDLTAFFVDDAKFKRGYGYVISQVMDYFGAMEWMDRPVICSWENLSGDVLTDYCHVPERIHGIFPACKIVVCIRSQFTMVPSLYHIYVKSGGTMGYEDYLKTVIRNDKLNYGTLIGEYFRLFGRDSVHVMLYEDLKVDQARFLKDLLKFIRLPAREGEWNNRDQRNKRDSAVVTRVYRLFNAAGEAEKVKKVSKAFFGELDVRARMVGRLRVLFFVANKLSHTLGLFESSPWENNPRFREMIGRHYGPSNQNVFRMAGLDLRKYGYPFGDQRGTV